MGTVASNSNGSSSAKRCNHSELATLFLSFVKKGKLKEIKKLIDANPTFDWDRFFHDTDGYNSLIEACCHDNQAMVLFLLEKGVQVDPSFVVERTAFLAACQSNQENIAKLLIEHGASVDATNYFRHSGLIYSCEHGHEATVKLLLRLQADVNATNCDGQNALMHACRKGYLPIVRLLLSQPGTDINHCDDMEMTALLWASLSGHVEVIQLLILHNADISCVSKYGFTPLTFACLNGHLEIASLLLGLGCDPDVKTSDGNSAHDLAKTPEIKELLKNHVPSTYLLK